LIPNLTQATIKSPTAKPKGKEKLEGEKLESNGEEIERHLLVFESHRGDPLKREREREDQRDTRPGGGDRKSCRHNLARWEGIQATTQTLSEEGCSKEYGRKSRWELAFFG